jgi:hypothetical protein
MKTYRVQIFDPRTRSNRMFWVSMADDHIDADSEGMAILQALYNFCESSGISIIESGRMHITCDALDDTQPPILITDGGHA